MGCAEARSWEDEIIAAIFYRSNQKRLLLVVGITLTALKPLSTIHLEDRTPSDTCIHPHRDLLAFSKELFDVRELSGSLSSESTGHLGGSMNCMNLHKDL